MGGRRATIAEDELLLQLGAQVLPSDPPSPPSSSPTSLSSSSSGEAVLPSGIQFRGWTFSSSHGKIATESEGLAMCQAISARCGADQRNDDVILLRSKDGRENHLHTPPMVFPNDELVLSYKPPEGGEKAITRLEFNVLDALSCWAVQHCDDRHSGFIPEVPYAHKWKPEGSTGKLMKTETTQGVKTGNFKKSSDSPEVPVTQYQEWDWTYSSPYNCTTRIMSPDSESQCMFSYMVSGGAFLGHTTPSRTVEVNKDNERYIWKPRGPGGINMDLLKRTDQPILFFDEVMLYQDDLEDCGESTFDLKVRVMPRCWFVLSRLFTRVDGGRLLLRETRLFHEFGKDEIVMELTWKQCLETHFNVVQPTDLGAPASFPGGSRMPPRPPVPPGVATAVGSVSTSQLRDSNTMSALMPSLPPLHSECDSGSSSPEYGCFERPMFSCYSLALR